MLESLLMPYLDKLGQTVYSNEHVTYLNFEDLQPEEIFAEIKKCVEKVFPNGKYKEDMISFRIFISYFGMNIVISMFASMKQDTIIIEVQNRHSDDNYKFCEYYRKIHSYFDPSVSEYTTSLSSFSLLDLPDLDPYPDSDHEEHLYYFIKNLIYYIYFIIILFTSLLLNGFSNISLKILYFSLLF